MPPTMRISPYFKTRCYSHNSGKCLSLGMAFGMLANKVSASSGEL